MVQPGEVRAVEWLGEDVSRIVKGADALDKDFLVGDKLPDVVVLHVNVFYMGMPDMIFSEY